MHSIAMSLFIALPMWVCAIFAVELLLHWRRSQESAHGWLCLWASVTALLYFGHFVYFNEASKWLPITDTLYVACNLSVYPLYVVYISQLTDKRPISSQLLLMLAITVTPIVFALGVGILYTLMTPEETSAFLKVYLYGGSTEGLTGIPLSQAWLHNIARIIFTLQVVAVVATGVRKIHHYNQQLQFLYADTEDKKLNSITTILWLLVITSAFSIVVNAIGRQSFEGSLLLAVPSVLFSVLLFCIGWMGLQTHSYIGEMEENEDLQPVESTDSMGPDFALLAKQFNQLMSDEQLFLQHDLRLDTVVQRLGTNRTYLLAALKQETGMTFNEFINSQRIAYARQLMSSNPSMLKSDVATRAGYNSLSAFYRNLKQYDR